MSFQIKLDKFDEAYGHFLRAIRAAVQKTFAQEVERRGLSQGDLAAELNVDPSVVSRRLSGAGNVTLKTICDLYTAMGREPLSNFEVRNSKDVEDTMHFSDHRPNSVKIFIMMNDVHFKQEVTHSLDPGSMSIQRVSERHNLTSTNSMPPSLTGNQNLHPINMNKEDLLKFMNISNANTDVGLRHG